jgi:hypothetical protein
MILSVVAPFSAALVTNPALSDWPANSDGSNLLQHVRNGSCAEAVACVAMSSDATEDLPSCDLARLQPARARLHWAQVGSTPEGRRSLVPVLPGRSWIGERRRLRRRGVALLGGVGLVAGRPQRTSTPRKPRGGTGANCEAPGTDPIPRACMVAGACYGTVEPGLELRWAA